MSLIIYTAPNCIRCRTVKAYMNDKGLEYTSVDFKENAQEFNTFYRANRKAIYRGAEGVEFPLFEDTEAGVVLQGSGVILAWLIAGKELDTTVVRSDMWHGWISGIYSSNCPDGQEDHLLEVISWLNKGGLQVIVQSDGRKADLLEKLLASGDVSKAVLNIPGGPATYERLGLTAPSAEELKKSIDLVRASALGVIRFQAIPLPDGDAWRWPVRDEVLDAARMVYEACQDHALPFLLSAATADLPIDMHGLPAFDSQLMVKFRSAARQFLFKADIESN